MIEYQAQEQDGNNHHFATLQIANPIGIFRTDPEGNYLYVNDRWCEITGLSSADVVGKGWIDVLLPVSDQQQAISAWQKSIQESQPFLVTEYRFQQPNGKSIWVFEQTEIERDAKGKITGYIGTLTDISDERRAQSLRETQHSILEQIAKGKTLLAILNALLLAIETRFDGVACSILLCDPEGKLRHGISPHLPAAYSQAIDGIPIGEGSDSCGTAAYRARPVIVSDIATDPLWQKSHRELALAQGLRACWSVPIVASDGQVLGTFALYYREIYTPQAQEIDIVVRSANIAGIALERTRAIQAMKKLNQKLEEKVAERTADLSKSQQFLQEANTKLSITNNELLRATRLKDEFLANMSHELRTPLNAILGIPEGLQEEVYGVLNERQQKSLATIERSGRHLLELINDILTVSKIEAGKLELEFTTVKISQLCSSSLSFVKQQAMQKSIQLETCFSDDLGAIVIDERRMRQVLINLLNNAVKFTPTGGHIRLEVNLEEPTTRQSPQAGPDATSFISFAITDTGIGIAADDLDKLFQPFVQISSDLNRQHEGTGLGLTLVKQIVELHGGSVSVTSEYGQGSCFTVRLPKIRPCLAAPLTDEEPEPSSSLAPDNNLVLIVEDSNTAAEQVCRYLTEMGMTSYIHPRGEGAVQTVIKLKPALIILDIILPNQSGWETLTQLKTNIRTKHIPVVMVSVMDERLKGISMGAAEFLVKPFTCGQLHATIETLRALGTDATTPVAPEESTTLNL